jgi:hypothetical protein
MSTQVTLTLPDTIYGSAESLASMTGRSVADILVTTIELSLPTFLSEGEAATSVTELSDDEVLAVVNIQMEPASAQRLSVLLERQQAGILSDDERKELHTLMHHYQSGLLRKAYALQEAVKRKLLGDMSP